MLKYLALSILLIGSLALAGLVLVAAVAVLGVLFWLIRRRVARRLPKGMILELDLSAGLPERAAAEPWERIGSTTLELPDAVGAIDRAAADKRVHALVLWCSEVALGPAQAQEVRQAVLRFRAAGKPVFAWADTLGEGGNGWLAYYVASAADTIALQPSGDLSLIGFRIEVPFVRKLLDKLGVVPRLEQRHEYKSVVETMTRSSMSEAQKTSLESLLGDLLEEFCTDVAKSRNLSPERVRELVASGPFDCQSAIDAGLIDERSYRDELRSALRKRFGDKTALRYLAVYAERASTKHKKPLIVAHIVGDGDIVRGESSYSWRQRSSNFGASTIAAGFRAAVEDHDVSAILFRVNSRGGSYIGSDTVWREVQRAKEAGKPVVVSMGDYAASGGYFVSAPADHIVAQAMTLTGSIGVAGGKFVVGELGSKVGIAFEGVETSANAHLYSANHDYDGDQEHTMAASFDRAYDDFTAKVGEGRGLDRDAVDGVARGRIWSGASAKRLGLVDELGGYHEAFGALRQLAKHPGDIELRAFPAPQSLVERAFGKRPKNSDTVHGRLGGPWSWLRELHHVVSMLWASVPPSGLAAWLPPSLFGGKGERRS